MSAMIVGIAPNGKVAMMDLGVPGSGIYVPAANNLYGCSHSIGGRVFTNSWGSAPSSSTSYYVGTDTDTYLYNNMDFTIFFAAGNFGTNGPTSVSMESQAKNVISVGSSQSEGDSVNKGYVSYFSSIGPAYDGRIKPDLVSPGERIISAQSSGTTSQSCATVEKMGTSMASPSAAGSALLVRQYFTGKNFNVWTSMCNKAYAFCKNFVPSGVLVKALLLQSGSPMILYYKQGSDSSLTNVMLSAPPDMYQGYGRITLLNILPLPGYTAFDLFVDDLRVIGQNAVITYQVTITDSSIPLK